MKNSITSAAIGARLERTARLIAPILVAVYVAGYSLGHWLHQLNDRLAAAWVAALGLQQASPATAVQVSATPAIEPIQADAAPAPVLPVPALPTTVKQLRALCRERGIPSKHWRSARKADLQLLLA